MQALRGLADPVQSIAVVGNGPITAYQRRQIDATDVVIRFNKLDNWCAARQPVSGTGLIWLPSARVQVRARVEYA